ncbi:MAG TPA: type III pantothenate kinase, partial [Anaerolineaceae bacterium]|nr:type III pantothenate kinase [Anaerolineaceae bacterium]
MLFVIDLGNTNLALGLYEGSELIYHWRLSTEHARMPDEYGIQFRSLLEHNNIAIHAINAICLSSVVPPLTERVIETCQTYLDLTPMLVTADLKLNVSIKYEEPKEVGADRIADAVEVQRLYGGPACIIDFGTATTFNALTAAGEYLGGSILPGVQVSADALVQRTSKLPSVSLETPPSVIGRNTTDAIRAGLVFGYVSLVEGMIARYRKELGDPMKVIATGGFVNVISQHTNAITIVKPWLT